MKVEDIFEIKIVSCYLALWVVIEDKHAQCIPDHIRSELLSF